jgi:hypothetical protein
LPPDTPPILILSHAGDRGAAAVCGALESRVGRSGVRLVTDAELFLAPLWLHTVSISGDDTVIRLPDGETLRSDRIGCVLNRLEFIHLPQFEDGDPEDCDFAVSEFRALLTSWLRSLPCPVINHSAASELSESSRRHSEWLWLAGRAGLPARELVLSDGARREVRTDLSGGLTPVSGLPRKYLVAGERVVGPCPEDWEEPSLRLARIADCSLLEITWDEAVDGNRLACEINPMPPLMHPEEVGAVASLLETSVEPGGPS